MSPEQTLKQLSDFKSDIWILGIILFSIVTGDHPFEEDAKTIK